MIDIVDRRVAGEDAFASALGLWPWAGVLVFSLVNGVCLIVNADAFLRFGRWIFDPMADLWKDQVSFKSIWWMPWRREAMKDVARCDKPRGAASRL